MARVLIIEDSPTQAAIIADIVKSAGHEAVVCSDVSKGINQVIKPVNPDLVLLDLVLLGPDGKPMGDGFQICREIKRVSKNTVPVVVISSKGDEESAEWAILQGADAFLQKPFAVEDLLAVLAQVLGS
jgi:twitching motility two-component system response regulator PilH